MFYSSLGVFVHLTERNSSGVKLFGLAIARLDFLSPCFTPPYMEKQ